MKHIVGVSLGSSQRDHAVTMNLGGTECRIERFGTDGDVKRIISLIEEYDGKVDALGLGGIDLYIYAVDRRYEFRDARKIVQRAKKTPIVDGSGVKHVLERRVIEYLQAHTDIFKERRKVLLTSAMDRLGMAQALYKAGCDVTLGDFLFVLNWPLPLKTLKSLVTQHQPCPLAIAHRIGPAVGKKIDIDIPRSQQKSIVAGLLNRLRSLCRR
jgi:hypothetical protein